MNIVGDIQGEQPGSLFFPQQGQQEKDVRHSLEARGHVPERDDDFTKQELVAALHAAKSKAAPGDDGVIVSMLSILREDVRKQFSEKIKVVWRSRQVPQC